MFASPLDFSPARRIGIEPKVFYRLLKIGLGDVVACHADLASQHSNQVDHAPGKPHILEHKSVHQSVKLAMNIRQLLVGGVELDSQGSRFSLLGFRSAGLGVAANQNCPASANEN